MENTETQLDKDVEAVLAGFDKGTDSALLDDLVHEAASALGSSANNEGLEGQVRFLVEQWGKDEALKEIKRILE